MHNPLTRIVAGGAVVAMVVLGAPLVAGASTTTTTTLPATTTTIVYTTMKSWQAADQIYLAKRAAINETYLAALDTAQAAFEQAKATATNSAERITARATLRLAIAEATQERAASLVALGKAPVKPVKLHH